MDRDGAFFPVLTSYLKLLKDAAQALNSSGQNHSPMTDGHNAKQAIEDVWTHMASPRRLNSGTLMVPLPSASRISKISVNNATFASESAIVAANANGYQPGMRLTFSGFSSAGGPTASPDTSTTKYKVDNVTISTISLFHTSASISELLCMMSHRPSAVLYPVHSPPRTTHIVMCSSPLIRDPLSNVRDFIPSHTVFRGFKSSHTRQLPTHSLDHHHH